MLSSSVIVLFCDLISIEQNEETMERRWNVHNDEGIVFINEKLSQWIANDGVLDLVGHKQHEPGDRRRRR